jgi:hypothetical protein
VVNVHRLRMANFTRNEIGYIVTHAFQICFCVRFQLQQVKLFNIAHINPFTTYFVREVI